MFDISEQDNNVSRPHAGKFNNVFNLELAILITKGQALSNELVHAEGAR